MSRLGQVRLESIDSDVVCFEAARDDEFGAHAAVLTTSAKHGAFPPNTHFRLREIRPPGEWEAPAPPDAGAPPDACAPPALKDQSGNGGASPKRERYASFVAATRAFRAAVSSSPSASWWMKVAGPRRPTIASQSRLYRLVSST